jgi:hypothetical protein
MPAPLLFKPSEELILKQDILARRQSSRRAPSPFDPVDYGSPIAVDQLSRFCG